MVQDETDVQHKTQCNSSWWQVSNHKIYWFHFKHYSNVTDDGRSCNLQKYLTYKKRTLLVIVKFMTNHDNFFSQYFLSVLDPLLGSPARYRKISRPRFTRGSRGYAAAQPMFYYRSQLEKVRRLNTFDVNCILVMLCFLLHLQLASEILLPLDVSQRIPPQTSLVILSVVVAIHIKLLQT